MRVDLPTPQTRRDILHGTPILKRRLNAVLAESYALWRQHPHRTFGTPERIVAFQSLTRLPARPWNAVLRLYWVLTTDH